MEKAKLSYTNFRPSSLTKSLSKFSIKEKEIKKTRNLDIKGSMKLIKESDKGTALSLSFRRKGGTPIRGKVPNLMSTSHSSTHNFLSHKFNKLKSSSIKRKVKMNTGSKDKDENKIQKEKLNFLSKPRVRHKIPRYKKASTKTLTTVKDKK
mmetsp:Transcript_6011/g.5179  ORF Transcript_6011/g.5179 Transcript_6011/m.5179 type:complete len:151 (+) Transcript_6011:624-1076(+)